MFGNQDLNGAQKNRAAFFLSSFFDIAETHMVKADDYSSTKIAFCSKDLLLSCVNYFFFNKS